MEVVQETDVERARTSIDGSMVDVVAVGRAIRGRKREELVGALRAQNPGLKVVDGLAPIPALLVAQIQEAVTAPSSSTRSVGSATYEQGVNRVVLTMRRPAEVGVVLHRLDPLYRVHQTPLFAGRLGDGRQHIPIGRKLGKGERYLVVRADAETSVHQVH